MEKAIVTQDFLYEYLTQHNFTITMVAKRMGVSEGIVRSCFRHNLNRHGNPLSFSAVNVRKLNDALEVIANELRESVITFGSAQAFTNQRGTTYDPGTLPALQHLGEYFNMKGLTERVLGWNKTKKDITLSVKSSPMYGKVSADDVARLNAEVLAVSGMLGGIEVEMPDQGSSSSSADDSSL
jgi:hypothetical protein